MNMTNTNQIDNSFFCEFVKTDETHYECNNCGIIISVVEGDESTPLFPCAKNFKKTETDSSISFAEKIKNFGKALSNHLVEGMPQCTSEQILERYSVCEKCEFLQNGGCSQCGCPIFRNKRFASKLAWADQECPVGKWKKVI